MSNGNVIESIMSVNEMIKYYVNNYYPVNKLSSSLAMKFCVFSFFFLIVTSNAQTNFTPVLGNYNDHNFEEFFSNDHVNTEKLTNRLVELGANTFMWGIEKTNSWTDLKQFLPKAKEKNINVWVFLRPPTETPPLCSDCPYSEPYKLDFIKWAKEIAKLSLQYSNLIGYTIDDFWYNFSAYQPGSLFSKNYVHQIVSTGKEVNNKLKFYPILYFRYPQIELEFVDSLASEIDGIIAAYPGETNYADYNETESLAIEKALSFLDDDYQVVLSSLSSSTHSNPGDFGFAYRYVKVTDSSNVIINLYHHTDRALADDPGYQFIQIRIDGKVVWNNDVTDSNGISTIDLTNILKGKEKYKLSIGIYDKKEIWNSYLHSRLQIVSMKGIEYVKDKWEKSVKGNYNVNIREGNNSFNLPLIVMPAADLHQYKFRYDDEATPENVAKRIRELTPFVLNKNIEGIITYELDINSTSKTFKPVKEIFQSIRKSFNKK